MSLPPIPIPTHFRTFNFIVYNGYSQNALKDYQGDTIPSIGILNKFYCPIHKNIEYLYGTDIDYPIASLKDLKKSGECIVTKTKYGNHIICNKHITNIHYANYLTKEMTIKYGGDEKWYQIGVKQGYFVWRIYGKYADNPYIRVIKPSNDYVLSLLQQLYDIHPAEAILRKLKAMIT